MKHFEYKVTFNASPKDLNTLGEEGWELVSTGFTNRAERIDTLKREYTKFLPVPVDFETLPRRKK